MDPPMYPSFLSLFWLKCLKLYTMCILSLSIFKLIKTLISTIKVVQKTLLLELLLVWSLINSYVSKIMFSHIKFVYMYVEMA